MYMHQGNFTSWDVILLYLLPPLFGAGVGLLLGIARGRPILATLAGLVGGSLGAGFGLLLYFQVIHPFVTDSSIFAGCLFGGFFLSSISIVWFAARPPVKGVAFKPAPTPLRMLLGGLLGFCLGLAYAYMMIIPGSAAGMEGLGYVVCPAFGLIVFAIAGWLVARHEQDTR